MKDELFSNESFVKKNNTGNRMYSRSVEMFISFILDDQLNGISDMIDQIQHNVNLSYEQKNSYIETVCNLRNPSFQKRFRKELMREFRGKCALCDINKKSLLIASHIVPYSDCESKSDMFSPHNGLLLCVIYDFLFDKHLISFDQKGNIIINNKLNLIYYNYFNINKYIRLDKQYLYKERLSCLRSHLNTFKEKEK